MKYKRSKIILLACTCVMINALKPEPETLMGNLPGYAITTGIQQLNSTRCRREMEIFRDAVDHGVLWSLRMLDASGQPASGYISGNNYWLGNRLECKFLSQKRQFPLSEKKIRNNSLYRNPAEEFPPFELNFFGAHLSQNGTMQYHISLPLEGTIALGLCLPASCSENEVGTMLKKVFDDRLLPFGQLYSTDFELIKISNLKDDHAWLLSGTIITILFILTVLFGTTIVATLYDILIYQKRLQKKTDDYDDHTIELKNNRVEKSEYNEEDAVPSEPKAENRIVKIFICFSAYSNMKQIFKSDNSSNDLKAIHGIKMIGIIWVIFIHVVLYGANATGNKAEIVITTTDIEWQILANGTLSVDMFFFISGFLVVFGYLKLQKNVNNVPFSRNVMIFISVIIKRYIRVTPTYLIIILLGIISFAWVEKFSLMYFHEPIHELCSKYWWRNILYINTLYDWNNACLTWSWYIADNMQFFVFSIFVLMLSSSYYYTALSLSIATMFSSMLVRAYVVYDTGYIPTFDMQFETPATVYVLPWMRIPPYMVGMGTSAFLAKCNYKLHLSKKALAACWFLSVLCNCSILFGISNRNVSLTVSVLYETFSRFAWSLGIAWLVIACATNNGGIINQFLSLKYWIPFSRVTFCAYLLNPLLIQLMGMFSDYPFNVDVLTTSVSSIGMVIVTYSVSFVLSAIIEVPTTIFLRTLSI
ncbi:nose resistant to fluoxetine protein 6-like isoform X3 [Osmia bicornis bicornis]|uniref:nose resistant to fluoxetine protein 6-like isoform X3 n=1 Tax=Osmia bicornis bicornis TaxID=1437191 RepID=UPI001EAEDDD5|nr:nose resistant to fluoxetine protein 6-like isoform X3 [Osmia bicornis bicornis]